jgi:DNA-directed RNA polymerase II subunit RPB1
MGIVQDALLGIMLFTKRETFLEKYQVMQLIMNVEESSEIDYFSLPVPAILKPQPLWTGK